MPEPLPSKFGALIALIVAAHLAQGCAAIDRNTADMTARILKNGTKAFFDENDFELAREATAANMKMVDALLESSPENADLLILAAQGYSSMAFGQLEDDMLRFRAMDNAEGDAKYEAIRKRAQNLYRRARAYGERAIALCHPEYSVKVKGPFDDFLKFLKEEISAEDVPAVFFTAFAWGGLINISRDDMMVAADLGRVEAMMERMLELDPGFFNAGPHLFFGVRYAGVSKELGGSPAKSKEHFLKVFELTYNRHLLAKALYAQFYAPLIQDEDLYDKTVEEILSKPDDIMPGGALFTVLAKRRAEFLKTRKGDFF